MGEAVFTFAPLPFVPPVLPNGYTLRPFRAGDEATWLRIHEAVGIYDSISPALFAREFGDRADDLPERQLYVVNEAGIAVATGTAWFPHADHPPTEGRIHWIATVPAHQRRGIASGLVRTLLNRLRALGHETAYLTTGGDNHPAIALYRSLGFSQER